jgi:hypothetical protein
MALTALWVAIGAALGAAGLFVVVSLHRGRDFGSVRLAGVGPLSRVTLLVMGLSLLGAGYHVLVHALGLMAQFRAPLGITIGVAIVATLGSIGVDALDRRLDERGDAGDGGGASPGGADDPRAEKTPRSEE